MSVIRRLRNREPVHPPYDRVLRLAFRAAARVLVRALNARRRAVRR